MLPCANLLVLPFILISTRQVLATIANDTAVVGSLVYEAKIKAPADLTSAGSRGYKTHESSAFDDDFGDDGFKKLSTGHGRGKDAYNKFNSFHATDGDGYGYSQSYAYKDKGKKGGAGDDGFGEDIGSFEDEDEAANLVSPKYTEWHFDPNAAKPTSYYGLQSEDGNPSNSKLVGPDYGKYTGLSNKREKRKKDNVQPSAATEYDNYDYADVEEPEEAPADFEAEEAPDPEYSNVYADQPEAYDYY